MKRIALLSLFAALAVAGYVRAAGADFQARIDAFHKEAAAKRKSLGLEKDRAKLVGQFPTPEVTFETLVPACPAQTVTVKVAGKFSPGTAFVFESDDVQVLSEKATPTSWEAEVKVKPSAAPKNVYLAIISPVSGISRSLKALSIACGHEWVIDLPSGERLTVRTDWPKDGKSSVEAEGDWSKAGKSLAKPKLRISANSDDGFGFERQVTQEETMSKMGAMTGMMRSKEYQALDKRQAAVSAKMSACSKLTPPPKTIDCMTALQGEMNAIAKEREALIKKSEAQPVAGAPASGCDTLTVEVLAGGKLEGDADRCVGLPGRQKVTGTVKAL